MNRALKYFLLLLTALGLLLLCLSLGSRFISPLRLTEYFSGNGAGLDLQILFHLRLPRLLTALLIGSSLSVSGAIFQAVLKNPLSDPYTTGVSGGAALGATLAVVFSLGPLFLTLFSFAGSLAAVLIVFGISRLRGFGGSTLILAGIALSFVLSSGVLLIFAFTKAQEVHKALLWLMGDLSLARYALAGRAALLMLLLLLLSLLYRRHLDILSLGDEFARSHGIGRSDVMNLFWIASLLAALSVSLAGIIGFVGLVVPHLMRRLIGADHGRLLPASALAGGVFLALSDTIGRTAALPYEIPAGIITGFIGGLFFLFLLVREGRQ